jgi:hypothetical protein
MLDKFDTRSRADRINAPMLIFHSTDDSEVPFTTGETPARELGPRGTFVRITASAIIPIRGLTGIVVKWAQGEGTVNDLSGRGTARKMIELYGKEAQTEARRRCEKALQQDDMRGFERWAAIAQVIGGHLSRPAIFPTQSPH